MTSNIFHIALENYIEKYNQFYNNTWVKSPLRIEQLTEVTDILSSYFPFNTINCIETGGSQNWRDGMVGYYFATLSNSTNGNFYSVDNDPKLSDKVYEAYLQLNPQLNITHTTQDSVEYLKNIQFIPNLVHLDSWDLNLKDPFPSALHGWREFEAIESRMPVGSIIIVDDNYHQGTWQEWLTVDSVTKEVLNKERIDITYPLVGKGSHIFQWALREDTNWKILSKSGSGNRKIIIQKTH